MTNSNTATRTPLAAPSIDPSAYDAFECSTEDLCFWLELARELRGPILELGCGTGRVSVPLASAGFDVFGIDHDRSSLRLLMVKYPLQRHSIHIFLADVRSFALAQRFPLVIGPARFLEHLHSFEDQVTALQRVSEHLSPGGLLALHLSLPPPEHQPRTVLLPLTSQDGSRWLWYETLDREHQLRVVLIQGAHNEGQQKICYGPLRLRWLSEGEFAEVAELAHLERIDTSQFTTTRALVRNSQFVLFRKHFPPGGHCRFVIAEPYEE